MDQKHAGNVREETTEQCFLLFNIQEILQWRRVSKTSRKIDDVLLSFVLQHEYCQFAWLDGVCFAVIIKLNVFFGEKLLSADNRLATL